MKCSQCKKDKPEDVFQHGKKSCADCLAAIVARRHAPPTLPGHQRCTHCANEKPEEVFDGKKQCPDCRARRAARRILPPTIPGHQRCTRCAYEKPEEVFDGKKQCPDCRAAHAACDAARNTSHTIPGHQRCTHCSNEKPEDVFNGKKYCPDCLATINDRRSAPPTLPGHRRCTACTVEKPEEVFEGRKHCPDCRYYRRVNYNTPAGKLASYNRTCKRRGSPGSIDMADWYFLLEHFNHKCAYCASNRMKVFQKDHVNPINGIDGTVGVSWLYNTVPACGKCNPSKSDNEWLSWFRSQPFYCHIREAKIQAHMDSKIEHTDRTEFAA
jgi:hypothetical protein